MGILEIGIVVAIISAIIIFRKQISALVISAKRGVDKHTKTSIKIDLAIKELRKKQVKQKETRNLCNENKAKLAIQAHRELETAVKMDDLRVRVIEDAVGRAKNGGEAPKILKDEEFNVVGFSKNEPREFFDIGKSSCWRISLFEVVSNNKNTGRYNSLKKLMDSYERRALKLEELVVNIDDKITSLENDKQYVMTMESLIDIEQFESEVDASIDNITAEIEAIEQELELEEKLNGNFVADETPEYNNQ